MKLKEFLEKHWDGTQGEFAAKAGCKDAEISQIKHERRTCSFALAEKIVIASDRLVRWEDLRYEIDSKDSEAA